MVSYNDIRTFLQVKEVMKKKKMKSLWAIINSFCNTAKRVKGSFLSPVCGYRPPALPLSYVLITFDIATENQSANRKLR